VALYRYAWADEQCHTRYEIAVDSSHGVSRGVAEMTLDGVPLGREGKLALVDDDDSVTEDAELARRDSSFDLRV